MLGSNHANRWKNEVKEMKSMNKLSIVAFVLFVAVASTTWAQVVDLADVLIKAHDEGQPIPVLSLHHPAMDVKMAYGVQKAYVENRLSKEKIAGFKAGLTSEGGQRKFGVDAPLAGVLFEFGKLMGDVTVDKGMFAQLMIETEIGFVIGKAIPQSLKNVAELQQHIKAVMPVIELPDLGFADMKQLKGVDIIAANVAAKQFILGQEKAVKGVDLNAVMVSLSLYDQEVNTGKGKDALGDQWQAALWLVNTMIKQDWKLAPGYIVITGALGKMLPGKPGKYVADYGSFGKITFEIK